MTKTPLTRILSGPLSMFGAKVQIAALEKGIPFELTMVPFTKDDAYEPKHPDVLRVNPVKQQVPVLIDGDGRAVRLDADLRVPRRPLPATRFARAVARRHCRPGAGAAAGAEVRRGVLSERDQALRPAGRHAERAGRRRMRSLRALLRRNGRPAGHARVPRGPYSFADIAFYMAYVFADRKGAGMTDATPRLLAWRDRVGERPAVRAVVDPMMQFLASEGAACRPSCNADRPAAR
jgi:glutathione S-transferase